VSEETESRGEIVLTQNDIFDKYLNGSNQPLVSRVTLDGNFYVWTLMLCISESTYFYFSECDHGRGTGAPAAGEEGHGRRRS